jgi:hypothetical protein
MEGVSRVVLPGESARGSLTDARSLFHNLFHSICGTQHGRPTSCSLLVRIPILSPKTCEPPLDPLDLVRQLEEVPVNVAR